MLTHNQAGKDSMEKRDCLILSMQSSRASNGTDSTNMCRLKVVLFVFTFLPSNELLRCSGLTLSLFWKEVTVFLPLKLAIYPRKRHPEGKVLLVKLFSWYTFIHSTA